MGAFFAEDSVLVTDKAGGPKAQEDPFPEIIEVMDAAGDFFQPFYLGIERLYRPIRDIVREAVQDILLPVPDGFGGNTDFLDI